LDQRHIPELGRQIRPLDDVRAFWKLLRLIFREKPAIVHTHTAKAGTLGRLAALMFNSTRPSGRRCAVVHTFHGHVLAGYFPEPVNRVVRLAERALALTTDRIVTISEAQRLDIVDKFHVATAARTTVVPLGLNLEPLLTLMPDAQTFRSELGIGSGDFVVA